MTQKTLKLSIELVPSTCFYANVRSEVTPDQWNLIRTQVYSQAYNICQICGGVGPKHPVECHEIWEYDDEKLIQKLVGMIALCPDCHMVKHIGLARLQGRSEKALKHLMKVNSLKKKDAQKYIADAFRTWADRSEKKWALDISCLKKYGINE